LDGFRSPDDVNNKHDHPGGIPMTRSGKLLLIAGVLISIAGSGYAADPTQPPQTTQQSYTPGTAMAVPPPAADQSGPDHFVPPPGYYQDQYMVPYSRRGYGPKPS
jgi:hypothetical protein